MADEEKKTGVVVGHLIDFKVPGKGEKGPCSVYVGGTRLTFWKTTKDDDGDLVSHPLLKQFRELDEAKTPVKVKYEESEREFNGKKFTDYTPVKVATDDLDEAEIAKGDKASEEAKAKYGNRAGGKRDWQPRDESPVASRWAWSTALELAGEGVDVTKEATFKALVKTANKIIDGAFETEKHAKELWGKGAAKPAGPVNKAADSEPEKKEVDDF